MFISVDQLNESEKRFAALEEKPLRDSMGVFDEESLVPDVPPQLTRGNILGTAENLVKRKEMLETLNKEPVDFAFERAIGNNDSVYSNFVELIVNAKKKVGRVVIRQGTKNIGFATGFMVSENLLLTNWHVFQTMDEVANSEVQFFYELDVFGNPQMPVTFNLQADIFFHSVKELDYCFVAVSPVDISGKVTLTDVGFIPLDPSLGKIGSEERELLNIIHHPDGDYKQISIRENLFIKIAPTSVWYQTDTAPGSSGSPVFNDQWQVVALHHMGIGKKNESGDYIDRDGMVIPVVNGRIDASRIVWEANEGIRISVILKDIFSKFPGVPIVNNLQKQTNNKTGLGEVTPIPNKILPVNISKKADMESNNSNNVNISFPASLIEKSGGVININIKNLSAQVLTETTSEEELDFAEIKKLENSTDFSACKGYQSRFLGSNFSIPMPHPQAEIKKFIAKINGTDAIVLKYYNYSTIFNSVRMMPVISAININGDPSKRLDTTARKDVWLRDTRLSFDIQLGDSYYKNSGFDRGHMSRREDANWGTTAEDAKRNADLTCMYTNACPQIATINQSSRKGLWGILEKIVLENGAEAENGRTAKISVLNGPIFKDGDPVFRGIQVPMDFYKIVLWLTDNGNLKATAFKLSQTKLVSDIDFEELDIDQNTEFKEYQCSIKSLHDETKIDFSKLFQFDTFDGSDSNEVELNSELELMSHISKHNKM